MSNIYDNQIKEMQRLINYGRKENTTSNSQSIVEYCAKGADGKTYGIIREGHNFYIKVAPKKNTEILAEDYDYIGGFNNRKENEYSTYTLASKQFDLKLKALNEAYNAKTYSSQYKPTESSEWQINETKEMRRELNRYKQLVENVNNILEGREIVGLNEDSDPYSVKPMYDSKTAKNQIKDGSKTVTVTNKDMQSDKSPKSNGDGWPDLGSALVLDAEGKATFEVTAEYAEVINANGGLRVQGMGCKVNEVYFESAIAYETTGTSLAFDEWGQIPASAFLGYTENAKVVFTATVTGAEGYVGWGNGSIQSLDGKVTVANLTIKGEGDNKYSFTLKDLKEALLSGPNQYGNFGVVFNQWAVGDGACTCVRKSVEIFEVAGAVGEEITATVNDGESIGDAIGAAAPLGTKIGKLTINLQEGATVRLNSTLKISDDLTINGNGAIIDAWNVGANPLILLTGGRTATAAAAAPHRAPETMVSGHW